ncbi:hypothetical protein IEU95_10475 [Hoyosella rhizosphaerae]|uniref:Uncharacterized protein n=1 Tax=Hoyosella rhizosphaerae TaxID=1755582 RepID=A0A916TYK8_9ACTN|nr:hypothetical protein [Hoyosella rhizosphaerae]MBN4927259.1 hypothetical protein [Hoyosella rhizosphaerae]GGC52696.1 hypothetical protein GCM10011410_01270 [Hoyosella rhizosphaerae]
MKQALHNVVVAQQGQIQLNDRKGSIMGLVAGLIEIVGSLLSLLLGGL